MSAQGDLQLIQSVIDGLDRNRVARLAYEQSAFDSDQVDGVDVFDRNAGQNVPKATKTDYNPSIIDKGVRTQAASVPRMGWNHYVGRLSYNVNKLVQKLMAFFNVYRSTLAHNANEYDTSADYRTGDICYTVESVGSVRVYTWYVRVSVSPDTIRSIPPTTVLHWAEMQEKTSYSSLLPFSSPGYRHKFTVADLTDGQHQTGKWYPVTTALYDFDSKAGEPKEGTPQVLIEAFCNGQVAGYGNPHRAEFGVLAKFTGFADSSTDILVNNSFVDMAAGTVRDAFLSPIGFTKLVKGRQAVIWLRGGSKYALWNSFGSEFTLHVSQYSNGVDTDVLAPVDSKNLALTFGTVKARVKTVDATDTDDAVTKGQMDGALPLPRALGPGVNLRSIRTPGVYIVPESAVADSIQEMPVGSPGPFELVVIGDKAGLSITAQKVTVRGTGNEYTRILTGGSVTVPWYLSGSPNGTAVLMTGAYLFNVEDGNLYVYYKDGDRIPHFSIDENGDLWIEINEDD